MQCFLWKLGLMLSLIITVAAQTPAAFVEVSGTVYDESGKLIPGAAITLRQQNGEAIQKTTTSALGFFRFARVSTGSWELEAQKEAFKSAVIPLRIETPSITPLKIVLAIADLRDEITVDNSITQVNSNSAENLDVIKLDREALNNLPTLGNDAIGALANLVDASSTGTGGATIIVDGLEMTKKTPASRIQ